MDVANLVLGVDYKSVDQASGSLGKFTGAARQAENQTTQLGKTSEATGRKTVAANENSARAASRFSGVLSSVKTQLLAVGAAAAAAISVTGITAAANAYTEFSNTLRVAGVRANEMAAIEERLFRAANRHGAAIGSVATLYQRASIASNELGASQEQILRFIEGTTAALRLQGGSASSASGALLQLSQALGSGIVRAEEFNSILEGAYPIAQAAARGIEGMGGSVAKLRQEIAAGNVTSKEFFAGLLEGFTATEAQALGMSLTMGAALTSLNNSFTRFIGHLDQSVGFTSALAQGIVALGTVFDTLREHFDVLIVLSGTLSGALLAVFGPAMVAAVQGFTVAVGTGAVGAVRALTAAIMANPMGLLITALGTAVGLLIAFRDETFKVGDATVSVSGVVRAYWTSQVELIKGASIALARYAAAFAKLATGDFTGAWESFTGAADAAMQAIRNIGAAWQNLGPRAEEAGDSFEKTLKRIQNAAAGVGGSEGTKKAEDALKDFNAAVENAEQTLYQYALANSSAMRRAREEFLPAIQELEEALNSMSATAEQHARAVQLIEALYTAAGEAGRAAQAEVDRFGDSLLGSIEAIRQETAAVQLGAEAHRQLIEQRRINNDALALERDLIKAVADGYDLQGRTIGEVVEAYRQARSELNAVQEEQRNAEEVTRGLRRTTGSFISDLRYGMGQAESAWEGFANAATRAIDRVTDLLLNDLLDAVFQVNGAGSKGGGIFGSLMGLFGLGGGGPTSLLGGGGGVPSSMVGKAFATPTFSTGGGIALGGLYADGGNPPVGIPSIVGERGPELFIPKAPGTIIPNHALGEIGGTTVNVTINGATGNKEVRELVEQGVRDGIAKARPGIVKDSVAATYQTNKEVRFQ